MQYSKTNYRWVHNWQTDLEMLVTALETEDRPGICATVYTEDAQESGVFLNEMTERMNIHNTTEGVLLYADQMAQWDRKDLAAHWVGKPQGKRSVKQVNRADLMVALDQLSTIEPFDRMGREATMLIKYPFLLKWMYYLRVLILNPVTIFLMNKWRLVGHLAILAATLYGIEQLQTVNEISYFLQTYSWLVYPLWIPYAIKVWSDLRWLNRLYLLFDGCLQRYLQDHQETSNMALIQKLQSAKPRPLLMLTGLDKCDPAHRNHVYMLANWYMQSGNGDMVVLENMDMKAEVEQELPVDMSFSLPLMTGNKALQSLAELSGIQVELEEETPGLLNDALSRPFNREELEVLYAYRSLLEGGPAKLSRFFLNYRLISTRFHKRSIPGMMLLLIVKCFSSNQAAGFFEAVEQAQVHGHTTTGELIQAMRKDDANQVSSQDLRKMQRIEEIVHLPIEDLHQSWKMLRAYL